MNFRRIRVTEHAQEEASRRGIPLGWVVLVASEPEQILPVLHGREVRQSRLPFAPQGRIYLVRVIVEREERWDLVVTAYRTSKIQKYWAQP